MGFKTFLKTTLLTTIAGFYMMGCNTATQNTNNPCKGKETKIEYTCENNNLFKIINTPTEKDNACIDNTTKTLNESCQYECINNECTKPESCLPKDSYNIDSCNDNGILENLIQTCNINENTGKKVINKLDPKIIPPLEVEISCKDGSIYETNSICENDKYNRIETFKSDCESGICLDETSCKPIGIPTCSEDGTKIIDSQTLEELSYCNPEDITFNLDGYTTVQNIDIPNFYIEYGNKCITENNLVKCDFTEQFNLSGLYIDQENNQEFKKILESGYQTCSNDNTYKTTFDWSLSAFPKTKNYNTIRTLNNNEEINPTNTNDLLNELIQDYKQGLFNTIIANNIETTTTSCNGEGCQEEQTTCNQPSIDLCENFEQTEPVGECDINTGNYQLKQSTCNPETGNTEYTIIPVEKPVLTTCDSNNEYKINHTYTCNSEDPSWISTSTEIINKPEDNLEQTCLDENTLQKKIYTCQINPDTNQAEYISNQNQIKKPEDNNTGSCTENGFKIKNYICQDNQYIDNSTTEQLPSDSGNLTCNGNNLETIAYTCNSETGFDQNNIFEETCPTNTRYNCITSDTLETITNTGCNNGECTSNEPTTETLNIPNNTCENNKYIIYNQSAQTCVNNELIDLNTIKTEIECEIANSTAYCKDANTLIQESQNNNESCNSITGCNPIIYNPTPCPEEEHTCNGNIAINATQSLCNNGTCMTPETTETDCSGPSNFLSNNNQTQTSYTGFECNEGDCITGTETIKQANENKDITSFCSTNLDQIIRNTYIFQNANSDTIITTPNTETQIDTTTNFCGTDNNVYTNICSDLNGANSDAIIADNLVETCNNGCEDGACLAPIDYVEVNFEVRKTSSEPFDPDQLEQDRLNRHLPSKIYECPSINSTDLENNCTLLDDNKEIGEPIYIERDKYLMIVPNNPPGNSGFYYPISIEYPIGREGEQIVNLEDLITINPTEALRSDERNITETDPTGIKLKTYINNTAINGRSKSPNPKILQILNTRWGMHDGNYDQPCVGDTIELPKYLNHREYVYKLTDVVRGDKGYPTRNNLLTAINDNGENIYSELSCSDLINTAGEYQNRNIDSDHHFTTIEKRVRGPPTNVFEFSSDGGIFGGYYTDYSDMNPQDFWQGQTVRNETPDAGYTTFQPLFTDSGSTQANGMPYGFSRHAIHFMLANKEGMYIDGHTRLVIPQYKDWLNE